MKDLPRVFIYRDKAELDDFLNDNPLNDALYDVFLDVKDSYYYLKRSPESIFNEVYYQCTRLMLDPHPEARVRFYLDDAKENMGTRYASDLVFSMVYAVLSLQPEITKPIKRFLRYLEGQTLNECYFPAFQEMVSQWNGYVNGLKVAEPRRFKSDFTSCPEPPEKLERALFLWSSVTKEYNQDRIRMIVNLWEDMDDKLAVLDKIEKAFDDYEAMINDGLPF